MFRQLIHAVFALVLLLCVSCERTPTTPATVQANATEAVATPVANTASPVPATTQEAALPELRVIDGRVVAAANNKFVDVYPDSVQLAINNLQLQLDTVQMKRDYIANPPDKDWFQGFLVLFDAANLYEGLDKNEADIRQRLSDNQRFLEAIRAKQAE